MYIIPKNSSEIEFSLYIIRPKHYKNLKEKIRHKFKAKKNSEYERIVKRINLILFEEGVNLTQLYEKQFKVEYESIYKFLEEEEDLDSETIDIIKNKIKITDNLWVVRISDCEGYNFAGLFNSVIWEESCLVDMLNKTIKECEHEN